MPKAERGTPKDIANRSKAKGLQRLRWYCQMCSKQCRDENGMKCHMMSDSHLRMMAIFSQNAGTIVEDFSKQFEGIYLDTLRRCHGTKRVSANNIYQEVIRDKHHVHMNSTRWTTLGDFVQYLGKTSKCIVEETERGWYIQYIERDPVLMARQQAHAARVEAERKMEKRAAKRAEKCREETAKALDAAGGTVGVLEASKMKEREKSDTIKLSLGGVGKKKSGGGNNIFARTMKPLAPKEEEKDVDEHDKIGEEKNVSKQQQHKQSVCEIVPGGRSENHLQRTEKKRKKEYDEIDARRTNKKEVSSSQRSIDTNSNHVTRIKSRKKEAFLPEKRKDYWLHKNIIVRVISKKLSGGKYYKRKGIVLTVVDKYSAEVELLEEGDILRLDQDDLETVVPKKEGSVVRILNGKGRGKKGYVVELNKERCEATLEVTLKSEDALADEVSSDEKVVILKGIMYEDFSMIA